MLSFYVQGFVWGLVLIGFTLSCANEPVAREVLPESPKPGPEKADQSKKTDRETDQDQSDNSDTGLVDTQDYYDDQTVFMVDGDPDGRDWDITSFSLPEGYYWRSNLSEPVIASKQAERGGTLTMSMKKMPETLRLFGPDVGNKDSSYLDIMRSNFMFTLLEVHPNTREYIPSLATHWAMADYGDKVFFRLNPKATWSDGVPITPEDFEFAHTFINSEYVQDEIKYEKWMNVKKIEKVANNVIVVELTAAYTPVRSLLFSNIFPVPQHFHELTEDWAERHQFRAPPLPGPYKLSDEYQYMVEFHPNTPMYGLAFERLDEWWGDDLQYYKNTFNFDQIHLLTVDQEIVGQKKELPIEFREIYHIFNTRKLDFMAVSPHVPESVNTLISREPLSVQRGYVHKYLVSVDPIQLGSGIWLNTRSPVFSDQKVREAFLYGLDMEQVIETLGVAPFVKRAGLTNGYTNYDHPTVVARSKDHRKVTALMLSAGYTLENGYWQKDGKMISINILNPLNTQVHSFDLIARSAATSGFNLQFVSVDLSEFADYDGVIIDITSYSQQVPLLYHRFLHSFWLDNDSSDNKLNFSQLRDRELDRLIDQYQLTAMGAEKESLSHQIIQKVHDLAIFMPWAYESKKYYYAASYIAFPKVPGTRMGLEPIRYGWFDQAAYDEYKFNTFWLRGTNPKMLIDGTFDE
ncbi:MAG: ABC transporter substrate-binding protein [Proteobacteria bacterium]|nr:ABC transporter substrate-binding protein [Pseudomonadota bacterium]